MQLDRLLQELQKVIDPILRSQGVELVDLEYQRESCGWVLRIYIDREEGINVENCADLSRELGSILEVRDLIPDFYTLEVSSPGLTRPLKRPEDYNKYRNRLVKIKTFAPIEGRKNFKGILQSLEDENVYIQVEGRILEIPLRGIAKANLEVEF